MKMNSLSAIINMTESSTQKLFPLTWARPISALPFASRYRVVDFSLSSISHAGIDSVAIFIGGTGRSIYDHVRRGTEWNLESRIRGGIFTYSQTYMKQYMIEQSYGDNDYYQNHKEFLVKSKTEYVVVMGGRFVANVDYDMLLQRHLDKTGDITVTYKYMDKQEAKRHPDEKILKMDKDKDLVESVSVKDYEFGDEESVPVSMNIYVLSVHKMLEIIALSQEEGLRLDADRLVAHYLKNYQVSTHQYKGHLSLIDSIDTYYEANMELLDKDKFDNLFRKERPIMTKVKNESPTYYSDQANVKNSLFATGCIIEGTVDHSLIFRKVKIAENATVKDSILMQGVTVGKGAILEYCILDKYVHVEPGVVLKGTKENLITIPKNKTIVLEEEE